MPHLLEGCDERTSTGGRTMKHAHNQITDDLRCRLNVELARLLCEITFHQARTMDVQSGKGNNKEDEKITIPTLQQYFDGMSAPAPNEKANRVLIAKKAATAKRCQWTPILPTNDSKSHAHPNI